MLARNTLLTVIMLGGTCLLRADPPSIDPTALAAVHYSSSIAFGAGTNCPNNTPAVCFATILSPNIPAGQRLVITNISANYSFNPNGGTEVPSTALGMLLNVNGTIGNYTFPFDSSQQVGNSTLHYMNKSVKIFADPSIGFSWSIANLTGIGPVFTVGSGGLSVTVTGYMVPTK
jgi:hypothetical protein